MIAIDGTWEEDNGTLSIGFAGTVLTTLDADGAQELQDLLSEFLHGNNVSDEF